MADLQEFTVERSGTAQVNTPTWLTKGKFIDNGVTLADFTAGVSFPQVLGQLTATQQDQWAQQAIVLALHIRYGV